MQEIIIFHRENAFHAKPQIKTVWNAWLLSLQLVPYAIQGTILILIIVKLVNQSVHHALHKPSVQDAMMDTIWYITQENQQEDVDFAHLTIFVQLVLETNINVLLA